MVGDRVLTLIFIPGYGSVLDCSAPLNLEWNWGLLERGLIDSPSDAGPTIIRASLDANYLIYGIIPDTKISERDCATAGLEVDPNSRKTVALRISLDSGLVRLESNRPWMRPNFANTLVVSVSI